MSAYKQQRALAKALLVIGLDANSSCIAAWYCDRGLVLTCVIMG